MSGLTMQKILAYINLFNDIMANVNRKKDFSEWNWISLNHFPIRTNHLTPGTIHEQENRVSQYFFKNINNKKMLKLMVIYKFKTLVLLSVWVNTDNIRLANCSDLFIQYVLLLGTLISILLLKLNTFSSFFLG